MEDQYGRSIDYLRISVTDRCNLRCRYCMPTWGVNLVPCESILRFDEILRLVKIFVHLGIRKVKITGGEPLLRKDLAVLIKAVKSVDGIEEVTLTTNGILLYEAIEDLAEAGLDGINISLDTLDRGKYLEITGYDGLGAVLKSIDKCRSIPKLDLKINTVTLNGFNRNEICDLAAFASNNHVKLRFIEMMPIGLGTNFKGYSQDEISTQLEGRYGNDEPVHVKAGNGPARYYRFANLKTEIGFISAMSHKFCENCNRVRLTSEGFFKPCLGSDIGVDLRRLLRTEIKDEDLSEILRNEIYLKPSGHCFKETDMSMWRIGG